MQNLSIIIEVQQGEFQWNKNITFTPNIIFRENQCWYVTPILTAKINNPRYYCYYIADIMSKLDHFFHTGGNAIKLNSLEEDAYQKVTHFEIEFSLQLEIF